MNGNPIESGAQTSVAAEPLSKTASPEPSETQTPREMLAVARRGKRPFPLKPNPASKLLRLLPEQRDKLVAWLFDLNLSYRDAAELCVKEFGLEVHFTAIGDFYRREVQRRQEARLFEGAKHARDIVKKIGNKKEDVYQAVLAVIAQAIFDATVSAEPGEKPDFKLVMGLLPLVMDARKKAREEREFLLERERWEFDAVRMCHDHFKELQVIIENQTLDEPERLDALRKELFPKPQENKD